jgi:ferritin-like metal-binding protein YciE
MTDRKDDLLAWLRDAHAMEAATADNLERLIGRADPYPPLKRALDGHLQVTRRQRDAIGRELERLESDTSALKDMAMKFAGRVQPFLAGLSSDEMPKHCIAAYGWQSFQIASYRSMLGAAEELGMAELRQLCERFIKEEQTLADFLFENLPEITRQYLQLQAVD